MRRWRKIEIIHLFNGSRIASEMGLCYPERRLANRRLDRVVCDIAALLSEEVTVGKTRARKGDRKNGTG
jgi:hypothetical protein